MNTTQQIDPMITHQNLFRMITLLCILSMLMLSISLSAQGLHVEHGDSNNSNQEGGYIWVGDSLNLHLSLDNNEIQARYHKGSNTLNLNPFGGSIRMLQGNNAAADLLIDGSGLFYDNSTNRVGIGTTIPSEALHVNGFTNTNGLYLSGDPGTDDGYIRSVDGGSADLWLISNDNIRLELDDNDGEAGEFEIFNGINRKVLSAGEEDGMTVFGNRIKLSTFSGNKSIEFTNTGGAVDINSFGANLHLTAKSGNDIVMQENFAGAGSVGIGTASVDYKLEVNGSAGKPGGGSWSNSSDARLKKNITEFDKGLELVKAVRPINFEYNGLDNLPTHKSYVGVIAQELKKVAPFMVSDYRSDDGEIYLAVDPSAFDFVLINAVKELSAKIEQLEKQVAANKPDKTIKDK